MTFGFLFLRRGRLRACLAFVFLLLQLVYGVRPVTLQNNNHADSLLHSEERIARDFLLERPLQIQSPESQAPLTSNHKKAAESIYILGELQSGVSDMQSSFFQVWVGTWPTAIDWTAAAIGTHISAILCTLSRYYRRLPGCASAGPEHGYGSTHTMMSADALMDSINGYFAQTSAYYFGQNALALRTQANDDKLWVVLGWLESLKFIDVHDQTTQPALSGSDNDSVRGPQSWHGRQFEAAFAHRARIFYELVSSTWNSSSLCGGGLTWDANKAVYKNTVTNTLYISAAIGMYLYHPGDANKSPFMLYAANYTPPNPNDVHLEGASPHDSKYLKSAIEAYEWLRAVNLTNSQGLYADGYHISNSSRQSNSTAVPSQCDIRNEDVYTYNQGIILSGARGLWEGTGNITYLEDGHRLIRNVIRATGWNLRTNSAPPLRRAGQYPKSYTNLDSKSQPQLHQGSSSSPTINANNSPVVPVWHGLGRLGILEEACDVQGSCSQDAQTFKGLFFHHFSLFCEPLPTKTPLLPGRTFIADEDLAALHRTSCSSYRAWVEHNARAAIMTKDASRRLIGMWWTAGLLEHQNASSSSSSSSPSSSSILSRLSERALDGIDGESSTFADANANTSQDANDRGRGRTLETQSSGVAVIRAWWELSQL